MKKTTKAMMLGFVLPGLGHLKLGYKRRGKIILVPVLAMLALFVMVVLYNSGRLDQNYASLIWIAGIVIQAVVGYDL